MHTIEQLLIQARVANGGQLRTSPTQQQRRQPRKSEAPGAKSS
jgi:hypothetical protein